MDVFQEWNRFVLIRRFFRGGGGGCESLYLRSAELVDHDKCKIVRKCWGGGVADTS